jgi:hypothetical protein
MAIKSSFWCCRGVMVCAPGRAGTTDSSSSERSMSLLNSVCIYATPPSALALPLRPYLLHLSTLLATIAHTSNPSPPYE